MNFIKKNCSYYRPSLRAVCLEVLCFLSGFEQGIYDFAMKMDFLGFSQSLGDISYLHMVISIPLLLRLFPAILSDNYPVGEYHRKPYMISANFIAAIFCLILSQKFYELGGYVMCIVIINFFICAAEVNYDACAVEDTKKENNEDKGDRQTLIWAGKEFGFAFGEIIGPIIWKYHGSHIIYLINSALFVLSAIISIILPNIKHYENIYRQNTENTECVDDGDHNRINKNSNKNKRFFNCSSFFLLVKKIKQVMRSISNPILVKFVIFYFILCLLPNSGIPMFYYLLGPMRFSPEDMAVIAFLSGMGRSIGVISFSFIKNANLLKVFIFIGIIEIIISLLPITLTIQLDKEYLTNILHMNNTLVNSMYENETITTSELIGIDKLSSILAYKFIVSMLDGIRGIPLITLTSILCHVNYEASAISFILSSLTLVNALNKIITGILTNAMGLTNNDFSKLFIFLLICLYCNLISILFGFALIPNKSIKIINNENNITDNDNTNRIIEENNSQNTSTTISTSNNKKGFYATEPGVVIL